LHGARIEVQLALRELQTESWWCRLAIIDAITTKQQKVNAHRKFAQLNQKMLTPAVDCHNPLADEPLLCDLRVAADTKDSLATEPSRFFFEDDDRWTFGHEGATHVDGQELPRRAAGRAGKLLAASRPAGLGSLLPCNNELVVTSSRRKSGSCWSPTFVGVTDGFCRFAIIRFQSTCQPLPS
jgi:hypothetical protein